MNVYGIRFLVIGTGLSGYATCEFLLSKGAKVILTDIKAKDQLNIDNFINKENFKGIFGGQPPLSILDEIDYIIVSPGVSFDIPIIKKAHERNIELLSEIELSYRLSKGKIIAITGTNGKTTTTSMVGEIFKYGGKDSYVVGNIGLPMISKVDNSRDDTFFIVEVSSFQLEGIKEFHPDISAILNITPDHLNRHKTMDNYIGQKSKVFVNQGSDDITILNADNPISLSFKEEVNSRVVLFSQMSTLEKGIFVENNNIVIINEEGEKLEVCPVSNIKVLGGHNLENALAAVAISYYAGISVEGIRKGISEFKGVEHRIERVAMISGIEFINDSKGTNPESSIKAIEAMEKPIILIGGGMDKGSDFTEFVASFKDRVKYLILLGQTADVIENAARKQGFTSIKKVDSIEDGVLFSFEIADKGDVVLLSPGCASWDMYTSYEERGNIFKSIVKGLGRLGDA